MGIFEKPQRSLLIPIEDPEKLHVKADVGLCSLQTCMPSLRRPVMHRNVRYNCRVIFLNRWVTAGSSKPKERGQQLGPGRQTEGSRARRDSGGPGREPAPGHSFPSSLQCICQPLSSTRAEPEAEKPLPRNRKTT